MAQQQAMQMEDLKQQGQLASAPINDPTKNPALAAQLAQTEGAGPLPPEA